MLSQQPTQPVPSQPCPSTCRPKAPIGQRRLLAAQKPKPSGASGKVRKADLSAEDAAEAAAAAKLPVQNAGAAGGVAPPGGNERAPVAGVGGSNGTNSDASSGNATSSGDGSGVSVSAAGVGTGADALQPLSLPPCDFGTELNFVGAWRGDSVRCWGRGKQQ